VLLPNTDYERLKQLFKPSALLHRKRSLSVEPDDPSLVMEVKLLAFGLVQFNATLAFGSLPSTPGRSTPFLQPGGTATSLLIVSP